MTCPQTQLSFRGEFESSSRGSLDPFGNVDTFGPMSRGQKHVCRQVFVSFWGFNISQFLYLVEVGGLFLWNKKHASPSDAKSWWVRPQTWQPSTGWVEIFEACLKNHGCCWSSLVSNRFLRFLYKGGGQHIITQLAVYTRYIYIYCLFGGYNGVIFPITHYQNQNNPLRSFLLFSVSSCRQRLFWDPKWIDHQEVMKVHQGIFISEWLLSFGFDKTRMFFLNQASSETDFLKLWPQQHGNCDELCHLLSSVFPFAMWCRCSFWIFLVSSKLLQKKVHLPTAWVKWTREPTHRRLAGRLAGNSGILFG